MRIKGLKKMLLGAMRGGKWGLGQEPRKEAMELAVSGPLRCPLRPPPTPSPFPSPRRPQPGTRRPLRPVLASQL